MDYRLNNEALISCCISSLIEKQPLNVVQLTLIIPILLNDNIRSLIVTNPLINISDKKFKKIGIVYREYLPYVMNSIVLLIQGECIEVKDDLIKRLPRNTNICLSLQNGKYGRVQKIMNDLDCVLKYICSKDVIMLFKELNISL